MGNDVRTLLYVSGKAISTSERELEEKGFAAVSESVGTEATVSASSVAGELGSGDDPDDTTAEH